MLKDDFVRDEFLNPEPFHSQGLDEEEEGFTDALGWYEPW